MDGELTNGFQRGLEQLHIEVEAGETVIEGDFADTAALSFTLDRLKGQGFGLIAVSLVDAGSRRLLPTAAR